MKERIRMASEFGKNEKKKGHFVGKFLLWLLLFTVVGVGFFIGKKIHDVNNKYGIMSDEIVITSSSASTSSLPSSSGVSDSSSQTS
jgi:hypothetical protein